MNAFANSWQSAALSLFVGLLLLIGLPAFIDDYTLLQFTIYAVMAILGVSLGFIWGYGGILCFGQAAFFGLGAYTYAIAVINIGDSTLPFFLSIIIPALFAAALGYVIFYGRLSDVYMGVITLTVTLILFNLFNSTAGPEWKIGTAPLGGFNGIPAIPTLNYPGKTDEVLSLKELFYLTFSCLLLVYLGLRVLISSKVGRVIIAAKENEHRVLLLGYDARAYKLFCFTLGGAIAGPNHHLGYRRGFRHFDWPNRWLRRYSVAKHPNRDTTNFQFKSHFRRNPRWVCTVSAARNRSKLAQYWGLAVTAQT
jgi:ABC-type branched-subunit amino acid transport system permease subunit